MTYAIQKTDAEWQTLLQDKGAEPAAFDRYEAQVRREYAHVPDEAFRLGRAAVLERFAQRGQLYFSDWGRARFEAAARANLARSLAALRGD